jgi:hypothetical protein
MKNLMNLCDKASSTGWNYFDFSSQLDVFFETKSLEVRRLPLRKLIRESYEG